MIKSKKRLVGFYALFFVLFALVMYSSPHTVDDAYYDYLNITNLHKMIHFSAGYGNGRVLGNLLAIVLCKSQLFFCNFQKCVCVRYGIFSCQVG